MIPDEIPFEELDSIVGEYIKENPESIDAISGLLSFIAEYYKKNPSKSHKILRGEEFYEEMINILYSNQIDI